MDKISVIIPTRNRPSLLKKCIESVINQDYSKKMYEIIVVDDGSDTEINKDIVNNFSNFRKIKYLKQEHAGPAVARNLGIRESSYGIVAFIDDDCFADRKWLKYLDASFSNSSEIKAVEGRTITRGPIGPFSHFISNGKGGMYTTSNMAFKKDVLKGFGCFDETFRNANREDSDIAFKFIENGRKIAFENKAVVYHSKLNYSFLQSLKRKRFFMWDILLEKKHPSLYKNRIKYPFERFTLPYIFFSLISFINPILLVILLVISFIEIKYRNYKFNLFDYIKFSVLQIIGSFVVVIYIFYGVYKFRIKSVR